ncbi:MAG: DUF1631 domain-containing protein [Ketobacteraceae bacterium]|nr:DUF1631 domain-containing protein [Ketobacteraceae bacterium]
MDVTDAKQTTRKTGRATPELVDRIASRAVSRLGDLLADMYEHIDDTLFDLADRAYNNSEQSLYFESMREIRQHRTASEQVFTQSLENGFQRLRNREYQGVSHAELEAETLALVDNDEMEADVAINNMVHRARCEFPAALLQLNTRLNTFLPDNAASEDTNPIDPKSVVRAFIQATQDLDLTIKIRLILYKEFEKYVLRNLDEILFDANQTLIDAGVLPDIRATLSRSSMNQLDKSVSRPADSGEVSEKKAKPAGAVSDPSDTGVPAAEEIRFDTLQSLLTATANLQQESIYIQRDPAKPALNQRSLFDWLSSIQQQQLQRPAENDIPEPLAVRQEVFNKLKAGNRDDPGNRLQQVDDNVINVVDMIFEFILDQDIPAPMAALIGRLQIPILKVAIRDQAFFDSHQHPARRLLNEIAHAALGWDGNSNYSKDPLYQKVENVVKTILHTEHPSVELFARLEKDFHGYVDGETRRSEKLAQRTADAEEGRARAEAAKQQIEQLIHDRIHGKELPPVVLDFLERPWQKYLLQTHLKFGNQSEEWRNALTTADDLIWSVQMHADAKARQRWIKMIPPLLDDIREGLTRIAHSPSDTEKTMTALWQIHSKMLSHEGENNPVNTVKVDLTGRRSRARISPLVKRKVPPETIRELRTRVSGYGVGDWFEFQQLDGKIIRCRLIRKIRANDSFVFANRYGAKAKAVTKDQLALYIHDNKAKRLESGPLIDRALQAVMLRLKHSLP